MKTKKECEKILDEELKTNKELKKVLEDPKKKEAYIQKMLDHFNQCAGMPEIKGILCETCIYSKSNVVAENGPKKGWCRIYSKDIGVPKPLDIVYDNGDCLYYRKEEA